MLEEAQPLFVVGLARSGTPFVARLLNAHPAILQTNEVSIFLLLDGLVTKSRLGVKVGLEYPKEGRELAAAFWREKARELIIELFERLARASGKVALKVWGDKHPHHCNCLSLIFQLFPPLALYLCDPRPS